MDKPIVQQCTEESERGNITHTGTAQATRQTSSTVVGQEGQLFFPEGTKSFKYSISTEHAEIQTPSNTPGQRKEGVAFICVCSPDGSQNQPSAGTALKKCIEEELGYNTKYVGDNMTSEELRLILVEIEKGAFPHKRTLFYFFGHGDSQSIQTADGYIEYSDIVSSFEKGAPDIPKLFIFECCRNGTDVKPFKMPLNTVVIYATDFNTEAYYKQGMGHFAKHFTRLAPKLNVPLSELICQVRKAVDHQTQAEKLVQVPVDASTLTETVNFLAQSQGTARVVASNVTVVTSATSADLKWDFDKNVEYRINHFRVVLSSSEIPYGKGPDSRTIHFPDLDPGVSYKAKVVVVYDDDAIAITEIEFQTHGLKVGYIQSVQLAKIRESTHQKAVYLVNWKVNEEHNGDIHYFRVVATPVNEAGQVVTEQISDPHLRSTDICLKPGLTYTFLLETYYSESVSSVQKKRWSGSVTVPTKNNAMAQATVVSTSQNAATLKVLKPAVLEDGSRYAPEDITIKYFAKEVCCSHGGNEEEYKEFSPPCTFYCNSSSEVEQHITNLKLGTSYSVTLRTEYSTGDCVDSNPIEFKTKPYTGRQHCYNLCGFVLLRFLLFSLLFGSCTCFALYAAYSTELHRSEACIKYYYETFFSTQCGEANSLWYEKIRVGGDFEANNQYTGAFEAVAVKPNELMFYSGKTPQFGRPFNVSKKQCFLLEGVQYYYLMTGSIIYGNCCIINNGNDEVTANLSLFKNSISACHIGQWTENPILTDSIKINPGDKKCFNKWGTRRPFHVTDNSFYSVQVDLPGNITIIPNVELFVRYVNVSDYPERHHFTYNSATEISLSNKLFSMDDSIVLCSAVQEDASHSLPEVSSNVPYDTTKHVSKVDAEDLYLKSCKKPYHWMRIVSIITLLLGIIFLIAIVVSCYCVAIKFRDCYMKQYPFIHQFKYLRRNQYL